MDFSFSKEFRMEQLLPLIEERLANGKCVTFSPRGTSMLPMLRQEKDTVTLSPLPEKLRKYDLPLYRREDGQFVLHRIVCVGDTYTCIGDNQFQRETGVRRDQMIALVTEFHRNGKKYSVESAAYRMYCIVWYYSRPIRYFWRRSISCLRRLLK